MSLSLLSYQLQIKKYLRELRLSTRDFNKLDVKHSDINLLKQLQLLNPEEDDDSSEEEDSGFYGSFLVTNEKEVDSQPRHMHAYLAYNDIAITPSQQINSNHDFTFTIAEQDRLPLTSSILQLKVTMQNNTESVNLDFIDGFEVVSNTENPVNEENTINMLVNAGNYDNGSCEILFIVNYQP